MSIDYDQLKTFVKEAMFTGGGINEPSAPGGVPHRMPAADGWDKEQGLGDKRSNELYELALVAREAAEAIVVALDEPIYDEAYEHAFKASASLRRVLNSIEETGAHPMPQQRVVAPRPFQQRYSSGASAGDYSAGVGSFALNGGYGLGEGEEEVVKPANARADRIAKAAGQGSAQSAEAIKQQLAAVLGGEGITPMKLRDALTSILADLGVPNEKQIGTLIAKAVANKKK